MGFFLLQNVRRFPLIRYTSYLSLISKGYVRIRLGLIISSKIDFIYTVGCEKLVHPSYKCWKYKMYLTTALHWTVEQKSPRGFSKNCSPPLLVVLKKCCKRLKLWLSAFCE